MTHRRILATALCAIALPATVWADNDNNNGNGNGNGNNSSCSGLPNNTALKNALTAAVNAEGTGFNLNMWATVVNRDGIVCAVAFTGADRGAQWPGSRVISAQKANTANAFGLDGVAISTANLYSAVQPGGSLFGLQESNPVATDVAYKGPSSNYGKSNDPMVGEKIGGVNVFGGGLGLYDAQRKIIGGVGVSGDTSCEDHRVAWRLRDNLHLDNLNGKVGFSGDGGRPDNMVFDINPVTGKSASGWGHPTCGAPGGDGDPTNLPITQ
jgi:uncharacterized protein GlcG (DUF336 family)